MTTAYDQGYRALSETTEDEPACNPFTGLNNKWLAEQWEAGYRGAQDDETDGQTEAAVERYRDASGL